MEKENNVELINEDLFDDEKIESLIKNKKMQSLAYTNKSDSVGVASFNDKFISYMTNEKGNVMYTKIFNVFFTALITSREIYNDFSYVDDKINKSNNK